MPFLKHVTGTRSCEDYSRILSDNPVTIESQLAEAADLSVGLLMSPGTRLRCLLLDRIEVGASAECRWRATHQETKRSLQRRSFGSIHPRGTTSTRAAVKALGSRIPIPKSLRSAARSLTSQDAYEAARCKYRVLDHCLILALILAVLLALAPLWPCQAQTAAQCRLFGLLRLFGR